MGAVISFFGNLVGIIEAVIGVFGALIVLFLLIPGKQPEKSLRKVVDFLEKFSRK